MRLVSLLPLAALALSGCIDEYQQCVRNSSKDLNVVNELIAKAQLTVNRGYSFETLIATEIEEVVCLTAEGQQATCLVEVGTTYQSPVAVDLEAERRKLAQLIEQRRVLEKRLGEAEQACRAAYPPEA
jgi:hypothetical protein